MKFSISAEKFFNAVNKLNFVVPGSSHTTLPIITNLYFKLSGNNLSMVSTDLEAFITTDLNVDGEEDGGTAVPARKLLELLKAMIIKNESVVVGVPFSKESFGILSGEGLLPEINLYSIKYDKNKEVLEYKGSLPEETFEGIKEEFRLFKEKVGTIPSEELKKEFSKLEKAVTELGKVAVATFTKLTEKLKIKFESNDKFKITVNSKNGKYSFFGEPIEDFPLPQEKPDMSRINISGAKFKKFLQKVKHSVKNDEIRRNMAGVFIDLRKNELRFVATDGFRLGKVITTDFSHTNSKDENFILPIKTVDLLPKIVSDSNIILEFDNVMIKCTMDNFHVYSKLIDDTFPNYESVIPKDNDKKLLMSRYDLMSALRRAVIFTDSVTKKIKFEIIGDELKIKSDNPEIGGEGEEILKCDFKTNNGDEITEDFSIAFNVSYLLDCLSQIETDEVMFTFSAPAKASIILPVASLSEDSYMELIMPVRVG
ncbi:MAG: DNA polymerase III subunit beta [Candidatus Kapaibacterium sp.]